MGSSSLLALYARPALHAVVLLQCMCMHPQRPQLEWCCVFAAETGWESGCKGPGQSLPGLMGAKGGHTPPMSMTMCMPLGPSTSLVGQLFPPVAYEILSVCALVLHLHGACLQL